MILHLFHSRLSDWYNAYINCIQNVNNLHTNTHPGIACANLPKRNTQVDGYINILGVLSDGVTAIIQDNWLQLTFLSELWHITSNLVNGFSVKQ